jgi:hypothetical protein
MDEWSGLNVGHLLIRDYDDMIVLTLFMESVENKAETKSLKLSYL